MALCSIVHFPESVVDLGTMKRPQGVCLVEYACMSKLCASRANRQFVAFNMSIPLTKTSSGAVNLYFEPGESRAILVLMHGPV